MLLGGAISGPNAELLTGRSDVIFQPGEEGGRREASCARCMMWTAGAQESYVHAKLCPVFPQVSSGFAPAVLLATDLSRSRAEGLGGHAATPHETIVGCVVGRAYITCVQKPSSKPWNATLLGNIVVSILPRLNPLQGIQPSSAAVVNLLGTCALVKRPARSLQKNVSLTEICEGIATPLARRTGQYVRNIR